MSTDTTRTGYDLPEFDLSPLPPIADAQLSRASVTHGSARPAVRGANGDNAFDDYEKLAHVGDSLLGSAVTLIAHRLFPSLNKGPATSLKALVVNNDTLAELARQYDLQNELVAHSAQLPVLKTQTKALAAMFEARVAVVFLDFLNSKIPGAYKDGSPNNALPPLTSLGERTDGAAFDYLSHWLTPLFEPIIRDFRLKMDVDTLMNRSAFDDKDAEGYSMYLNEYMTQKTGSPPEYTYSKDIVGWRCFCVATIDNQTFSADCARSTKKAAQTVAAYLVAKDIGLDPNVHLGKKRRFNLIPTQ